MSRTISTGIEDFKKIIDNNYYFVDKTLFIKNVIDNADKVCVITRPRSFSKTLNLNMLRYYFDITLDSKELFKGLKIMNEEEKYTGKMNKYPVIFLTLKGIYARNYKDSLVLLRYEISDLYSQYVYLLDSDKLFDSEKEYIQKMIDGRSSEIDLEISLKNLSNYLFRYYNFPVLILLDEYDIPLQEAYANGYYNEAIMFWNNFFDTTFKTNFNLYKIVITAVSRVVNNSIFSGANDAVYSVLNDNNFGDCFGFTESEVLEMLEEYNMLDKKDNVKNWYGGYRIGNTTNLYNPLSIINCVQEKKLAPYWIDPNSIGIVKTILKNNQAVKENLFYLLNGDTINVSFDENKILNNIENKEKNIWEFLTLTGYLKVVENLENDYAKVDIPNLEIKKLFEKIIINWYDDVIVTDDIYSIVNYLIKKDYESFIIIFKELVKEMFSTWDIGSNTSENIYHAFVLGLLVSLKDKYIIKSNKESVFGRYDILLKPIDKSNPAFIIEFKVVRDSTFEESINLAKKQIEDKAYETELISEDYKDIEKIVFAFQGKDVEIEVY